MTRRQILAVLFGVAGTLVLIWLGVWQLQRLEWKTEILERIDARIAAPATALPEDPRPEADRYRPVRAEGRLTGEEILVQSSLKRAGPGYRVIAVMQTDGRRVLLDRGFIPHSRRDAARPPGPIAVEGNLHWPREVDGFTPDPDREAGLWFARDVPSIAGALDTEQVLIVLRASDEADPQAIPLPVTSTGIPNDHLNYAITWFLLAAVWAAMTAALAWRMRPRTT